MLKEYFHNRFWWLPKVLGPLFLLICAFIPDMGPGAIAPAVLLIVFLASTVSIIRIIVRRKSGMAKTAFVLPDLLRPGLAIIIVILDLALLYASSNVARQFANGSARIAQKICQEKNECPDQLEGFRCFDRGSCTAGPGITAAFTVGYLVAPDRQTFRIGVQTLGGHLLITGGVKEELASSAVRH